LDAAFVGDSVVCRSEDASSLSEPTGSYKNDKVSKMSFLSTWLVEQGKLLLNELRDSSEDRK
jgi:hypothetical protein